MSIFEWEDCIDTYMDDVSENVSALIETIRKAVLTEVGDELIHLRKRVAELQDFASLKDEYDLKMRELKIDLEKARKESVDLAKKMKLSDFIDLVTQPVWICGGSYEYVHDKCEVCDKDRQVHFKSPSGKELTEPCKCAERKFIYKPVKGCLIQIEQDNYYECRKNAPIRNTVFHYVEDSVKNDVNSYRFTYHVVYDGEPFDSLLGSTYFTNLDDCKRYCAYKQEKYGKG